MLTSRERVTLALNHKEPDRVPLDLGGSVVTGMQISSVYLLRQALGLDKPGTPVKLVEPYQMLGEIKTDLLEALGVDVVPLESTRTFFGFHKEGWKPWMLHDGTPMLVPGGFNTEPEPNGDILQYPEGDKTAPPSGRMPAGGYYFDTIVRQPPIDDDNLNVEDNLEEFGPITDEELDYFRREADRLYNETDKAILANLLWRNGLRRYRTCPCPLDEISERHPRYRRMVCEHYHPPRLRVCHLRTPVRNRFRESRQDIRGCGQQGVCRIHQSAVFTTGTDFGSQNGPFISPKAYRDLYKPFHKIVNDWIHENTEWKSMIHSCGSIYRLLPDFIEAGFDILNPVQTGAAEMDPRRLKEEFGDQIVFWGGGVDTQKTLPFGTPDEVREEVHERLRIFGPGGGFVFNTKSAGVIRRGQ